MRFVVLLQHTMHYGNRKQSTRLVRELNPGPLGFKRYLIRGMTLKLDLKE